MQKRCLGSIGTDFGRFIWARGSVHWQPVHKPIGQFHSVDRHRTDNSLAVVHDLFTEIDPSPVLHQNIQRRIERNFDKHRVPVIIPVQFADPLAVHIYGSIIPQSGNFQHTCKRLIEMPGIKHIAIPLPQLFER